MPLTDYPSWVVYRLEDRPGTLKPTKIPYCARTGCAASSTNPETWCDYATATRALDSGQYAGIGFVFSDRDPYFFLDMDGCRDSENGELNPDAIGLCALFTGAAWEVSQSGEGIHIVGHCDKSKLADRRNRWGGWLEFYTSGRFMALGKHGLAGWQGNPDLDWTATLESVVPIRTGDTAAGVEPAERRPDWSGPEDDAELIQRATRARGSAAAVFGTKARFADLWQADPHTLGTFFPPAGDAPGAKLFDHSAADQALMNALAFWTGCDWPRMERLFTQSGLGQRDKWRKRAYYRNRTIGGAVAACRQVYNGNAIERREKQLAEFTKEGETEINPEELFAPIVDVESMLQRFYLILDGNKEGVGMIDSVVKKPRSMTQAMTYYAASKHHEKTGKVDPITGQEILKQHDAIKIWKDHPLRQSVDMVTWLPDGRQICEAPERGGIAFNIWNGLMHPKFADHFISPDGIEAREQWLQAWRTHLAYLIPIEAERERFEQWCAHIVQKPGELPQTAYLMYTDGTTGIGRNWLSGVMAKVLRGHVAAGIKISAAVDDKGFNGRLSRKLLGIVDEAKAGMFDNNRYQRAETLKSNINEQYREIRNKYGMEWTEYNCMRWLFFSNHADALPFDNHDRRIIVIRNPSERGSPEYYEWIYGMLGHPEFISAVFAHLMTLDLSDFKPGEHAPMNDAKRVALGAMENPLTKALREFVEESPADTVTTVGAITANMQMEHGINTASIHPRAVSSALKTAGIVIFPKRLKMNGRKETIALVKPNSLNFTDFWDNSGKDWQAGAIERLRNHFKITENSV